MYGLSPKLHAYLVGLGQGFNVLVSTQGEKGETTE
jgi:hypothetical protein